MFAGLNWIDWTIIAILLYYAVQGWRAGFADLGLSFVTFLIALWLAIKFHAPVGDFFSEKFGIAPMWTAVLGYIIVGFIAEVVMAEIVTVLMGRLPKKLLESKYNKWLGIVISAFNAFVLISFFLLVILALPLRGTIKTDIKASKIGNFLVTVAQTYGGPIESTIQQAKETAIKFMTVEPGSKERIALDIAPTEKDLRVDDVDERAILALVNAERVKAGVSPLTVDVKIIPVARNHSRDMFMRRYFSHVNPEGLDAGNRLENAGIQFTVAGENLAYEPDLETAHQGLMNSPGHRRIILEPSFHHIGIGIIATDRYGIMVTEDFTN
jgi:uncharacterized protein YkwD